MKFKGVTVTQDDFEYTLMPHFRPVATADWHNNTEFKALVEEYNLDPGEVAGMVGKSTWTILAWLKPRESKSSANVTDENLEIFKAALEERYGRGKAATGN
jgi:hypothetical protein